MLIIWISICVLFILYLVLHFVDLMSAVSTAVVYIQFFLVSYIKWVVHGFVYERNG